MGILATACRIFVCQWLLVASLGHRGIAALNILKPDEFALAADSDSYVGYELSGDTLFRFGSERLRKAVKRNPGSIGWLTSAAMRICRINPSHCLSDAEEGGGGGGAKFFSTDRRSKRIGDGLQLLREM